MFNIFIAIYFAPVRDAKYCDEYVCMSVCLSLSLSVSALITRKTHDQTKLNFLDMLISGVVICISSFEDDATVNMHIKFGEVQPCG